MTRLPWGMDIEGRLPMQMNGDMSAAVDLSFLLLHTYHDADMCALGDGLKPAKTVNKAVANKDRIRDMFRYNIQMAL